MSQFVIYPEKLKSDISKIDDISNNAINNAINQLHSISSGLNDISRSLSPVVDQLINKLKANQAKVRNLSQTGHTIVQKYGGKHADENKTKLPEEFELKEQLQ